MLLLKNGANVIEPMGTPYVSTPWCSCSFNGNASCRFSNGCVFSGGGQCNFSVNSPSCGS